MLHIQRLFCRWLSTELQGLSLHYLLARFLPVLYTCTSDEGDQLLIMPWWVEPQRHAVVVASVCVCLYVFHAHFSATAKNLALKIAMQV